MKNVASQKEKIQKIVKSDTVYFTSQKMSHKVRYPFLESKVLEWYENARKNQLFVTGPMITEKAMEIHKESGCKGNFRAIKGWLQRFKSRNGIKLVGLMEVKSETVCDQNAVSSFTTHLQSLIEYYKLSPEQIYNADETDLFWKLMPKPSSDKDELEASIQAYRERMTLLACSNATGNHKLPLVCIGRKSRGITSNDICDLPLIYYSQETAWMDTNIFYDWYHNIFVPSVRDHLKSCGLSEVALLIIDQNPSHPNTEFLKTANDSVNILYLSSDIKASLQPMQLGIIHDLKSFYRYSLLSNVIEKNLVFVDYEKQLTLLESLKMLGAAWDSVSALRIQQSFSKILSIDHYEDILECEVNAQSFSDLIETIPECILYDYSMDRLNNWLFADDVDCPRSSESYCYDLSTSEMDSQNDEETFVYKEVSESDNYVVFEEISSNEDNLVQSKTDELSENIEDILTTTQEDFIKNELEMIDENDFFEPNNDVSSEDALKAIDILLKFVRNDPKIESEDIGFLLELKDTICNRLNDV